MRTLFIPLFAVVLNASVVLAQSQSEENADNHASQKLVVEALNTVATHPLRPYTAAPVAAPPTVSGIGPSSNMSPSDTYSYSVVSDLRQLNF